jgi:hypothetical protein
MAIGRLFTGVAEGRGSLAAAASVTQPPPDFRYQVDLTLGPKLSLVGVLEDVAFDRHRHALFDLAPETGESAVKLKTRPRAFEAAEALLVGQPSRLLIR